MRWSAFPSDHAVLFFALATGIYSALRKLGLLMYLYFLLLVCFPRLYLGVHWFTDLVVGAILGIAMAWLGLLPAMRAWINRLLMPLAQTHPRLFYPVLFLLTYQIATCSPMRARSGTWCWTRCAAHCNAAVRQGARPSN